MVTRKIKTNKFFKMTLRKPVYFELQEFLTSSTARQKSIENMPSWEIVEHLLELAYFLDDLREAWGSGIKVSSGFRIEALNKAVAGSETSAHMLGYAADIMPANGKYEAFVAFLKEWLKDKKFDQVLLESKGKTRWIHIGYRGNNGEQRRQIFNITVQ